ncbi:GFA family protein [Tardiphaga sp. 862_B3_N4_1]|uniref:GFA family protein n=1 Tax=Tardiphaga sp. 862_B3_N4_1 TaxID=3240764 RepID=UPI003F1F733C
MSRTASCSCGQLSIVLEGEPRGVGICHCFACQRRTGSVFAALAGFGPSYNVSGIATEYVRTGDQGARFRFRFCPVCGTNLFHTEEGYEARSVAVAVGCLLIRIFRLRRSPSIIVGGMPGCPCRSASTFTTRIPRDDGTGLAPRLALRHNSRLNKKAEASLPPLFAFVFNLA